MWLSKHKQCFSDEGIIIFNDVDELVQKISKLTPDYYFEKLKQISINYQRAKTYFDPWKRLAVNIVNYKNKAIATNTKS